MGLLWPCLTDEALNKETNEQTHNRKTGFWQDSNLERPDEMPITQPLS